MNKYLKFAFIPLVIVIFFALLAPLFFPYKFAHLSLWYYQQKLKNLDLPEGSQIVLSDQDIGCGNGHAAICGGDVYIVIEAPLESEDFFEEMESLNKDRFDKIFSVPAYYLLMDESDDKEYSIYRYYEIISKTEAVEIATAGDRGLGYDYRNPTSINNIDYRMDENIQEIFFKEDMHYYLIDGPAVVFSDPY